MAAPTEAQKSQLLERVADQAKARFQGDDAALVARFARDFYENVPPGDLVDRDAETLFGAALSCWQLAQTRKPSEALVRAINPTIEENAWSSRHTVIEIVNDDMPFLVDSVTQELNRRDLQVQLVIHPIILVDRDGAGALTGYHGLRGEGGETDGDRESVMHIEIGELADSALLSELTDSLGQVLKDVRTAVADFGAMRARAQELLQELESAPPPVPADEVEEAKALLRWIHDDHYTFLGYREYRFVGHGDDVSLEIHGGTALGILGDEDYRVFDGLRDFDRLPQQVQAFLREPRLVTINKANRRSTVHRAVPMDAVAVNRIDADGQVMARRLFVGLLTSEAYSISPRAIPVLRQKVERAIERSGFARDSHDARALTHILENYPRDELFQIDDEALHEISMGILHLQERQRTALFARFDPYERFVSALVFVPRDAYTSELRRKFQAILERGFGGEVTAFYTHVTDEVLARLHFSVRTQPGSTFSPEVSTIEAELAEAARSWADRLQAALIQTTGEERGNSLLRRYRTAFPAGYRETYGAVDAARNIDEIERLRVRGGLSILAHRPSGAGTAEMNLKLIVADAPIPLSDVLPILEHMGLKVIGERPYEVEVQADERRYWIHDFQCRARDEQTIDLSKVREKFETAFEKTWFGAMEDDGFNQLVLKANLDWRHVVMLRAYAKFLKQAAFTFSQDFIERTLAAYPEITRRLVDAFRYRFDPDLRADGTEDADVVSRGIQVELQHALDEVANLDQDRTLRRYMNLIGATLRTNFYQTDGRGQPKPDVALKFDSQSIEELPKPRPMREIFVYSPRVEAVHLRGGKVARGGLRWSDRSEDFRTEILGLMKAQMVKNAVIVPVGSKGGFVVKRPPTTGGREAFLEEGIACYKIFINAMLDVTDNLDGDGVEHPPAVVRHDADDPYLVVAADKGTATFSDIANGVSQERGFWLDDAFASGGSAGYDHKKMGITARGAWESVKRHFREIGKDTQEQDFTVVGVGDMSGDVFGNGMLLSPHIRLIAAFNHMHIFVDPEPDAATGFAERQRLFEMPRSAWTDYDPAKLSKGGAVFDRGAKSIDVSPEACAALGIGAAGGRMTPSELMTAILKAPVELLWFGGIGTYVKAREETHQEAGDRANDGIRIDADALRAKVVGEGANLGVTQLGRVAYAQTGGRINTDAIDNSAGVDCSDHEVNIKIALSAVERAQDLTRKQRDSLLEDMTEQVAALVLQDNYRQTLAISMMQDRAAELLDEHARFIRRLERMGRLERAIEFLPDEEEIVERHNQRAGLTRPELSVLLAYAKIVLYDTLLNSDLPDDPLLESDLLRYFPRQMQDAYGEALCAHRLRREIIATYVTNSMVNRVGCTFVSEMEERTGMAPPEVARAYAVVRDAFQLRDLWREIDSLDNKVPARTQHAMLRETQRLVERAVTWFLRNADHPIDITAMVETYGPGLRAMDDAAKSLVCGSNKAVVDSRAQSFVEDGVPADLAGKVARLTQLSPGMEVVRIANELSMPVVDVAVTYGVLGEDFSFDWLRGQAALVPVDNHWQEMATRAVVEDLVGSQVQLCRAVLANGGGGVDAWAEANALKVRHARDLLEDMRHAASVDIAMLTVANRELKSMIAP